MHVLAVCPLSLFMYVQIRKGAHSAEGKTLWLPSEVPFLKPKGDVSKDGKMLRGWSL